MDIAARQPRSESLRLMLENGRARVQALAAEQAQLRSVEASPAGEQVAHGASAFKNATSVQPAAEPESAKITNSYVKGTPEREAVTMATGMAEVARRNIETTNLGANMYSAAKRALEDTDMLEKFRKAYGDDGLKEIITVQERLMAKGLGFMKTGEEAMRRSFHVSASMVTKTDAGEYRSGTYVATASGAGWSVEVKSTGEAKAIANGVDVSDQVKDTSDTGFSWAAQIARAKAGIEVDVLA